MAGGEEWGLMDASGMRSWWEISPSCGVRWTVNHSEAPFRQSIGSSHIGTISFSIATSISMCTHQHVRLHSSCLVGGNGHPSARGKAYLRPISLSLWAQIKHMNELSGTGISDPRQRGQARHWFISKQFCGTVESRNEFVQSYVDRNPRVRIAGNRTLLPFQQPGPPGRQLVVRSRSDRGCWLAGP